MAEKFVRKSDLIRFLEDSEVIFQNIVQSSVRGTNKNLKAETNLEAVRGFRKMIEDAYAIEINLANK